MYAGGGKVFANRGAGGGVRGGAGGGLKCKPIFIKVHQYDRLLYPKCWISLGSF